MEEIGGNDFQAKYRKGTVWIKMAIKAETINMI